MRVILCDESEAHEGIMYPFQIIEKTVKYYSPTRHRSVVKNKFSIIISALGALYTAERKCNYVTQVILLNFFKLKYASLHSEVMLHDTP